MSFMPSDKKKSDDSQSLAKPLTQQDDFCAELMEGKIDFSKINKPDTNFIVAVNTGDRNKPKLLASTIRGPFDFVEMVEAVGSMWKNEQHHAMVYLLTKDFKSNSSFLDEGTIDYIEANYQNIVMDALFENMVNDEQDVPAGLIGASVKDEG